MFGTLSTSPVLKFMMDGKNIFVFKIPKEYEDLPGMQSLAANIREHAMALTGSSLRKS